MWNKLQNLSNHPVMRFFLKLLGDPIRLYAVFLITTVMYYYHANMTAIYTVFAVLISFVLMKLYDFIAKHKYLGILIYLIYMFAGLEIIGMLANWGQKSYPISFMIWFLTPQSVVSFSLCYTIAIYLLMLGFLTSVVYYFSKITYRMSMQFLIMLIPLSFYAKENQHMPAILVIILLASYFLLMIYCKMLQDTERIRYLPSYQSRMSIAYYVLGFSILASVIPKPNIIPDREFIDNAMSYSSWSDILMNAISMFTDTTDNSMSVSNNARTIYYVQSPESLRLKTQTYSYYLANDSWNVLENYDKPTEELSQPITYRPQDVLQAILSASEQDKQFAKNYDLESFTNLTLPEQELQNLYLYTWYRTQVLPTPTRINELNLHSELPKKITQSATNTFYSYNFSGEVSLNYYSDNYARYETVNSVLQELSHENYENLLLDAIEILKNTNSGQAVLLNQVLTEYYNAYAYLEEVKKHDFSSNAIDLLAEQITENCDSDFEKAKAIEQYFYQQHFKYDLNYQKSNGENAEYFLTQSKTGVCYEFATAMVLLCRSAGLPARYAQGYNLSELYNRQINQHQTNYVIKVRDAHAFPEVYISGYGWLSFEPTVPSMDIPENTWAENKNIMLWGFVILALVILAGIIYMIIPRIREKNFRKKLIRMTPQQSSSAIFQHMRRQLRLPDSTTVNELAKHSSIFYPKNELFQALNVLLYRHNPVTEKFIMTSQQLAEAYIQWQASWKQFQKEQAQKQKQEKKRKGR
ncbi:MAG: transglutaminase-like domain-containing protein [Oscillospiraceae bacterium]|nr:transglutaminase-like domain-containing protein [Oscillospiraceae bacterium]